MIWPIILKVNDQHVSQSLRSCNNDIATTTVPSSLQNSSLILPSLIVAHKSLLHWLDPQQTPTSNHTPCMGSVTNAFAYIWSCGRSLDESTTGCLGFSFISFNSQHHNVDYVRKTTGRCWVRLGTAIVRMNKLNMITISKKRDVVLLQQCF